MYQRLTRVASPSLTAGLSLLLAVGCTGTIESNGQTGNGGVSGPGSSGSTGSPGSAGSTGSPGSAGSGSPGTAGSGSPGTAGSGSPGTAGSGSPGTAGSGSPGTAGTSGPIVNPPLDKLPEEKACTSNGSGPRLIRRLTAAQFNASVRTIFNDTAQAAPVSSVFSDPINLGFAVDENALLVQGLTASQLMDNAEAVAAWAASNNKLSQFGNCQTLDTTCAQKFVKAFGAKAFRVKLADSDARIAKYTALFMAEANYADGAQTVITAMLQSPYFLYRTELGTQSGSTYTLTPYEVASSLSYLLTDNMPDDTLLGAADQVAGGSLTMTSMIDQQAQRLLGSNAQNAVMGFMNGWLGLDKLYTTAKDDTVFALTKTLRDDMASETRSLILEAFNGTGGISELLTSNHSFLNKNLATFYGINSNSLGTTFTSVPFTSSTPRDAGLLAQASLLIGYSRPDISSPTQRGHMVRSRLLCQEVQPPPASADTAFKPPMGAVTTRQHFEMEHSTGSCASCHLLMDPLGFGFEAYDGFGRHRTTEGGAPIDDSGTVYGMPNNPTFKGLSGTGSLSEYLAQSDAVKTCMIRYWSYYAYGSASWDQDACTYGSIQKEAAAKNFALKSVLMGIIHAPRFTQRTQNQ